MRKINIIIAGLACALVFTFVLSGFRTEAAAAADKTPALGGWTLADGNTPAMMSEKDITRIDKVLKERGDNFNVIDLVATQVVSGANYKALCKGNDSNLYVVTWYRDLQGNANFTSAECVNIGAYSGL